MNSERDLQQRQKEEQLRELIKTLEMRGFQVRREKLKQGPGWKTVSGACRLGESNVIFVDRKIAIEEQILFLSALLRNSGIEESAQV